LRLLEEDDVETAAVNFSVDLHGRTALVTGAASGIGLAIATALCNSGCQVLLNDLDAGQAQIAARNLPGAEPLPGDVTDSQLAAAVKDKNVDILVNNAGFQCIAPVEDFPADTFRRLLDVMLVGPFQLCQAVVPGMKERGFGRIVNISSVHGKMASAYKSGYVSAKHGLLGLTRVLALETAVYGITANAVCPGYVDTPLLRNQLADTAASYGLPPEQVLDEVILRPVPQKRLLKPEEVAYMVLFLCSDAAAGITAQAYTIDGGWLQI
jgi:3-hydroxybutyrate dehydrogenase